MTDKPTCEIPFHGELVDGRCQTCDPPTMIKTPANVCWVTATLNEQDTCSICRMLPNRPHEPAIKFDMRAAVTPEPLGDSGFERTSAVGHLRNVHTRNASRVTIPTTRVDPSVAA